MESSKAELQAEFESVKSSLTQEREMKANLEESLKSAQMQGEGVQDLLAKNNALMEEKVKKDVIKLKSSSAVLII